MNTFISDLHGAMRRSDLVARIGEHHVKTALRAGLLRQPWRGVVVPRDRALERWTRAAAALLYVGEGAVLSGLTAAALLGCEAAATTDIHVLTPHSRRVRRRSGLIVHQGRIAPEDVLTIERMPVAALDLTVAELLCTVNDRDALAIADQAAALSDEASRHAFAASVIRRLAERADRRGTIRANALAALISGYADSPPESWLRLLAVDAGYPAPEPQVEIRDLTGRLVYVLDLAWPDLRIALEYDGFAAHEHRGAQDAERDARLGERGWIVIRVRADDLRSPRRVLDELATAFATRRRRAA